jgi:hypothetical protein
MAITTSLSSVLSDLQSFIQSRLQAFDPTVDTSSGSPADILVVQPILTKLGEDPFSTDIQSFIVDRISQEYPDVYAQDPSAISDVLVKPLILLLDPFKREIENIRINQSLEDPTLLSDDDADALVANVFETRTPANLATGVATVYFPNPTNVQVEITAKAFTADGLNYFPTTPISFTAEEMVFNQEGGLFFINIPVQAEASGSQYNIDPGTLVGITGIFGQVKVTNKAKFQNGTTSVDTPTLVADAQQALTERTLVSRRGATAQLLNLFQGDIRAVQVIGAGDPEMQRDILIATSPGHAWLTGQVSIYGFIALVQCITVDDPSTTTTPQPGDTLYVYLDRYSYFGRWAALPQNQRFVRLNVVQVISGPNQISNSPYQVGYLVQFSDPNDLLPGLSLPNPAVLNGGFAKVGTLQVSSLPDIGAVNLQVPNQSVHVYGHTDIYARPTLQDVSTAVFSNLDDDPGTKYFTIQQATLQTYGATAGLENKLTDATIDFSEAGVSPGDIITIESGSDAGTYVIGQVNTGTPGTLFITSKLTTNSAPGLRYTITKSIHVNLFEPKIPKLPFGTGSAIVPNNDLDTNIGSNVFNFTGAATDLVNYGAKIGDTIRLLSGIEQGDFTITGFTSGKIVTVDRPAAATETNLTYQVFTPMGAVVLPLVRVTSLAVLDSSQQTTGIDIPYKDPVAIVPTCDFMSAQVRGFSQRNSGYVLPQINDGIDNFVTGGDVAAASGDRRYSFGFDPTNGGIYKAMLFDDAVEAEFLFQADGSTDGCTYFLATSEDLSQDVNFPPIDPVPGDALTIKSGVNAGSYLIQNVIKFHYDLANGDTAWLYFLKIYGTFPVDIFRQLISFLDNNGAPVTKITNSSGTIAFPDFFVNTFNSLGTYLNTALLSIGAASPGAAALQAAIASLSQVSYEWGNPARGVLRSYFEEPTLFQQNTALNPEPTLYTFTTPSGNALKFRPDPNLYTKQELVPPRFDSDSLVIDYPRDDTPVGSVVTFSSPTRSPMFSLGIEAGDILSIHQEVFMLGSTGSAGANTDHQIAVQTVAGSTFLTALPSTGSGGHGPFNTGMIGDTLFIDQGADSGGYTIITVVNPDSTGASFSVTVDRPLTVSTPLDIVDGLGGSLSFSAGNNYVTVPGNLTGLGYVNKYITVYGCDTRYQGSYQITAETLLAGPNTQFTINRGAATGNFVATAAVYWEITAAPSTPPVASSAGTGTVLYGLQGIRIYDEVTQDFPITVVSTDLSQSQVTVTGTPELGILQPFRIYRPNIRRITPNEINENPFGNLFFFDTEVVSLGPETGFNISENSYLTVDSGTYESFGYHHIVDDSTLTYSMDESGVLEITPKILPLGSDDSLDAFLDLVGLPVQVSYERADVISQIQNFINSPDDRTTSANLLARHFLPGYVSYDASYSGGSTPAVIAQDIINYVNSLTIETPLDVAQIEKIIDQDGGDPATPTTVVVEYHDWNRKRWVEFSQGKIGGTATQVPYAGSPRVAFFIPGPDVSGQSPLPTGERINLTQD